MPRKVPDSTKRKKGKDKRKETLLRNGKYSSKHVRHIEQNITNKHKFNEKN